MRIRSNPLPRRLVDVLCFLIIGVFLPVVFLFEIVVVLPAFHEPGGFLHTFTFLMAMFLVFNIKGNMIACMMIDTSVDGSEKGGCATGSVGLEGVQRVPETSPAQILALQGLQGVRTEAGSPLPLHRLLHWTQEPSLLHGLHFLSICGIRLRSGLQLHLHVDHPGAHLLQLANHSQADLPHAAPGDGPGLWSPTLGLPCAHRFERRGFRRSHKGEQAKVRQRSLRKSEECFWRPHAYSLVISTDSQRSAG
ncbi:uncharacterized protein LOC119550131 isoform X3 [Drosophila subpulchrella]|uniref:uncharacterized protein LOC119550131 isoform X3 n=1 Tax=Drosophila subpulchrella TaxID=1486046 RepID=UPI0018A12A25|nr:uncharacterized protein LOC119550131 isoform X3 [Drosophila subpulchrella]